MKLNDITETLNNQSSVIPLKWFEEVDQVYAEGVKKGTPDLHIHINFWDLGKHTLLRAPLYDRVKREKNYVVEVDFSVNESNEKTGTGNQFLIFNTVLFAIKYFINKFKPVYLIFDAKESNRRSLYSRIIKKVATDFGYKLIPTSELTDYSEYKNYFVVKKFEET